ncbi:MAG: hypothetical protein PHX08_10540 [Lachnospiraceae bacterium]|nr:hypothetical protein [Lachnospiraceae bacterium]
MTKKEVDINETKEEKLEQKTIVKQDISFTSKSDEIRYYVKQKLSVDEECTKQLIIDYVKNNVKEPELLTENMFTNTLRILADTGEIIQVSRGTYRKGGMATIGDKVAGILRKAQQDISKVCTVNILNMAGLELDMLPLVQQCLATMSETENALSGKKEEGRV